MDPRCLAQLILARSTRPMGCTRADERPHPRGFEVRDRNRAASCGVGGASFPGRRAGARAGGGQRQSSCRRPIRASPSWRCARRSASSLERSDAKVLQVETIVAAFPEVKTVLTNVGRPGPGRSPGHQPQPGIAEHRLVDRSAPAQPDRGRGRDPRRHRQDPRHRGQRGLRPVDLHHARQRTGRQLARPCDRVRREKGQGRRGRHHRRRTVGRPAFGRAAEAWACASWPDRPQVAASVLRAYVNGEVGGPTGPRRRRPGRGAAAPAARPARAHRADAQSAGGLRQDSSPIALAAVASIEPSDQPRGGSAAGTCSAARPSSRRAGAAPAGDVERRRRSSSSHGVCCRA